MFLIQVIVVLRSGSSSSSRVLAAKHSMTVSTRARQSVRVVVPYKAVLCVHQLLRHAAFVYVLMTS
jgi:hypothetical protein